MHYADAFCFLIVLRQVLHNTIPMNFWRLACCFRSVFTFEWLRFAALTVPFLQSSHFRIWLTLKTS